MDFLGADEGRGRGTALALSMAQMATSTMCSCDAAPRQARPAMGPRPHTRLHHVVEGPQSAEARFGTRMNSNDTTKGGFR